MSSKTATTHIFQSGVRNWPASVSRREIKVFNLRVWDSRLRHESWQVYSWGNRLLHLLIDPLANYLLIHNGGSAKHNRLFWCTSEAAKEERKSFRRKHCGDWEETLWQPSGTSSKVPGIWKETFLWVVHDVNEDVMYCSICTGRKYPSFANLQSSLYIGCGSGGKFPIDSLVHHNVSKEHYSCSLQSFKSAGHRTNRPFYRYGGHIELIQFKEYYGIPWGNEHISFVFSSSFRDMFS